LSVRPSGAALSEFRVPLDVRQRELRDRRRLSEREQQKRHPRALHLRPQRVPLECWSLLVVTGPESLERERRWW
jgi:hypothetical protein